MYRLLEQGPDNHSTWGECWGKNAESPGRLIRTSSTLFGLADAVEKMGHDNWTIYGPGGRYEAGSRKEYWARPVVAKALRRLRKDEATT